VVVVERPLRKCFGMDGFIQWMNIKRMFFFWYLPERIHNAQESSEISFIHILQNNWIIISRSLNILHIGFVYRQGKHGMEDRLRNLKSMLRNTKEGVADLG